MREFLHNIYEYVYNLTFPIFFVGFILTLVFGNMFHNPIIFYIGGSICTIVLILGFIYLWLFPFEHLMERFTVWKHSFTKYKLSPEEYEIWKHIDEKSQNGYIEWFAQTQGDDLCGPWIKDYIKEEGELISKIHNYFYGEHWYIATPISASQCSYQMYYDIKDKVKYE